MTEDREVLVRVLTACLADERAAAVLTDQLLAINERAREVRTTIAAVSAHRRAREQHLSELVNGVLKIEEK